MTKRYQVKSGQLVVRSLLLTVACVITGFSACAVPPPTATPAPTVPTREWKAVAVEGEPLEQVWPSLHPETQKYLETFAATVPEHLPELAYVSSVILNPMLPSSTDTLVLTRTEGYAGMQVGLANVGSNFNQPNVLCLRNGVQAGCAPEADVWGVTLPPKTMALLQARIAAEAEDRLTFLFLAQDGPKRVEPGSQLSRVFVERAPGPPVSWVDAPTHAQLFGGCNFAILIKDPNNTDASTNTYFRSANTPHGTVIYLLIQLCEVTNEDYVRLIPIVDRMRVANLDGEVWQSAVRLTDKASVIATSYPTLG